MQLAKIAFFVGGLYEAGLDPGLNETSNINSSLLDHVYKNLNSFSSPW